MAIEWFKCWQDSGEIRRFKLRPEANGLLALMEFNASRMAARTDRGRRAYSLVGPGRRPLRPAPDPAGVAGACPKRARSPTTRQLGTGHVPRITEIDRPKHAHPVSTSRSSMKNHRRASQLASSWNQSEPGTI